MTPQLGTDGKRIVYPIRGMVQGFRHRSQMQRRTSFYVLALAITALMAGAALLLAGYTVEAPVTVVVLALVAAIAERSSVRLTRTTEQSISVIPTLIAAVLF